MERGSLSVAGALSSLVATGSQGDTFVGDSAASRGAVATATSSNRTCSWDASTTGPAYASARASHAFFTRPTVARDALRWICSHAPSIVAPCSNDATTLA